MMIKLMIVTGNKWNFLHGIWRQLTIGATVINYEKNDEFDQIWMIDDDRVSK